MGLEGDGKIKKNNMKDPNEEVNVGSTMTHKRKKGKKKVIHPNKPKSKKDLVVTWHSNKGKSSKATDITANNISSAESDCDCTIDELSFAGKDAGVLVKPENTDEAIDVFSSLNKMPCNCNRSSYTEPTGPFRLRFLSPERRKIMCPFSDSRRERICRICGSLASVPSNNIRPLMNLCSNVAREEFSKDQMNHDKQAKLCIERLSNERNYYRDEFDRLWKLCRNPESPIKNVQGCSACLKQQKTIEYLKKENAILAQEKFCLMKRLENSENKLESDQSPKRCCKSSCKRLQREKDLLLLDTQRLEEELDCLREKIKNLTENKNRDNARFQEQRREYECMITKLEKERRELIKSQGVRRITMNSLEEKIEMYSNMLKIAQDESKHIKIQYCQLKKLHEQCDKALLDTQAQLAQVEQELYGQMSTKETKKMSNVLKNRHFYQNVNATTQTYENVSFISNDIIQKLSQVEKDKEDLLKTLEDKTSKLSEFEKEAKDKQKKVKEFEEDTKTFENELTNMKMRNKTLEEKIKLLQNEKDLKTSEMENLQSENEDLLKKLEDCHLISIEEENKRRTLQAEIDHMNKEIHALTASNHQLQSLLKNNKTNLSVAIESVNESDNRIQELEEKLLKYESQIKYLDEKLENCHCKVGRKEMEIENLLKSKRSLQDLNEKFVIQNKNKDETISDLIYECQRLQNEVMVLSSKDRIINDLMIELANVKNSKDLLQKEILALKENIKELKNKLFKCFCIICDTTRGKCTFEDCLTCPSLLLRHETQCKATQVRQNGTNNSVKQVMAPIPLSEEQSSRVITSQSTLPGVLAPICNCDFNEETIVASLFDTIESSSPFSHQKNVLNAPLNIIQEEQSIGNDLFDQILIDSDDNLIGSSEEKEKYLIDNVTTICKIVQVQRKGDEVLRPEKKTSIGSTKEKFVNEKI